MLFKYLMNHLCEASELDIDKQGEPTDRDARLAVVILLMQLGNVDDEFAPSEMKTLVTSVGRAFNILDDEVGELLELGEVIIKDPSKLTDSLKVINDTFDDEQKEQILTLVWQVVLADGVADKMETRYAALVREHLSLSLEAAIRARQRAENC